MKKPQFKMRYLAYTIPIISLVGCSGGTAASNYTGPEVVFSNNLYNGESVAAG